MNFGSTVAEQHSLKSCGFAIAEVLSSSCGIAIADLKKVAHAHSLTVAELEVKISIYK
jgi:hypothetical protein